MSGADVELRVESVAVGGDGVARDPDGRVVFVPRAAPGDRVAARIEEEHGSYARASLARLLEAGPGRRDPPCPYYGTCGGCQLQHLTREAQLEAKRRAVADTLERIGGRRVAVPEVDDPGDPLGYRNRITLTLRRDGKGEVVAGYHRHEAPDALVDVAECPLAEEAVDRAWSRLRREWGGSARILPAGPELRITLRGSAEGGVALMVEGGRPSEPGEPGGVAEALAPALACYAWEPETGGRRLLSGSETFPETWLGLAFDLPPTVFLQANRAAAEVIEHRVDAALDGLPADARLLDLYAGVGARAIRWALRGREVVAVEADREAVEAGRRVAARAGAAVDLRAGRVEDHLRDLLPADGIVVNPPRRGLSRTVVRVLREADAAAVCYVSCDPATLARDLKRLGDGWRIASLRPLDAFPQTAHVETVVLLEPA